MALILARPMPGLLLKEKPGFLPVCLRAFCERVDVCTSDARTSIEREAWGSSMLRAFCGRIEII